MALLLEKRSQLAANWQARDKLWDDGIFFVVIVIVTVTVTVIVIVVVIIIIIIILMQRGLKLWSGD